MAVFEASPEGFRAQNMGRPPAHLVRELIQNAFDEEASVVKVFIKWTPKRGVQLRVTDDVPGGIRDERLVFTIWETDKADSPTKRGRMGRGLKEVVSVSDRTIVSTQGRNATVFERVADGDWKRYTSNKFPPPTQGTVVEAKIKSWKQKDVDDVVEYLRHIRAPNHMMFYVNDEWIRAAPALEEYEMYLPSVTFVTEEGERRVSNRSFNTKVQLFHEAESWVYEMGLPIEKIEFPMSIDVGQRVPLREQRDTLTKNYRDELFAKLVSRRIDVIPSEELKDNYVLNAASYGFLMSDAAQKKIADAWTEGKPYAATPTMMSVATGAHIPVVNLRTLPEAIRELVKRVGSDVKEVIRSRKEAATSTSQLTASHRRLIQAWEWLAEKIGRPVFVRIMDGSVSSRADFSPESRVLTLYREVAGDAFFSEPFGAEQLGLFIHEVSHWSRRENQHGLDFVSDAEKVGGQVASVFLKSFSEAHEVLRSVQ